MSTYTAIKLVARPAPGPVSPDIFEVVQADIPQAGPGEILVKKTHMSLDPAMTAELNELVESARDAAARADTDKAGQCAELLEALCAELDSRALAER